ncbi:3-hydroxyisobutyrate dehydrogenase [Aureococcus anophagefferens]|nr:3-hydroxyisobutyrate dehydrogenase [Aureococcus anophagefferens]
MSGDAVDFAVGKGCAGAADAAGAVAGADVVFTSLPRSVDVEALAPLAAGALPKNCVWVDTTSGVPDVSQRIYAKVADACGAKFLDCGVVHVGPSGAGHAVKSVNNTLLAAHIWVAYEGLLTLAKLGVPMETALAAINAASGRSLVTEERIPNHVLSREFDFGFALDLMRKDIGITMDTLDAIDMPAPALRVVNEMFCMGEAKLGPKAEHMEVVKVLEDMCGAQIKKAD